MKTINEIQGEIQLIINTHINLEDRLNALRASGYTGITFSWVKGGGIGKVFYLKRKRIYRIQVSASEIRGKFPIAYCVVSLQLLHEEIFYNILLSIHLN